MLVFLGISKDSDIVDFSGEPSKYFGIYGKILEIIGLNAYERRLIIVFLLLAYIEFFL